MELDAWKRWMTDLPAPKHAILRRTQRRTRSVLIAHLDKRMALRLSFTIQKHMHALDRAGLLQPRLERALRDGLRHLRDLDGLGCTPGRKIDVTFSLGPRTHARMYAPCRRCVEWKFERCAHDVASFLRGEKVRRRSWAFATCNAPALGDGSGIGAQRTPAREDDESSREHD